MTNQTQLPNRHATLRLVPMPKDTNAGGDIFGGWIMSQVDIAASIPASRRAKGRVVSVGVNDFKFVAPVFVNDIVSFYSDVIKVGTTSITVKVEVFVERGQRSPKPGEVVKVTEAVLTYVAVDENRIKRPVPPE
ncbi:MAG: acyl-CoA thioesterase [Sulfuricaulis sp.]|jgi:acyl-CoA thioesterase YciA|uniref:acyl-CoA thioesterase n=1 Tax=Sulfuricaulis sp. TaxID=2003553 RepID=UPI002BA11EBE|nr:acyl-CoA thioesterase [Sulfuricaulis sp.]